MSVYIERESRFMSAVLDRREAFDAGAAAGLDPSDFEDTQLGRIWRACLDIARSREDSVVDLVTVAERLHQDGDIAAVGNFTGLHDLYGSWADRSMAGYDARAIRRRGIMRRGMATGAGMLKAAAEGDANPEDVRGWAEGYARNLATSGVIRPVGMADAVDDLLHGSAERRVLRTGFGDFDARMAGMDRGSLVVVGGRPRMGKTAMMLDIARYAASQGNRTLLFSLEMPAMQIAARLVAQSTGISAGRLMRGEATTLSLLEKTALDVASLELSRMPLSIQDCGRASIDQIASRIDLADPRPDLVVLDYLQLIPTPHHARKHDGLAEVTAELKRIARDLNGVVLAGSQLNRASSLAGRRPTIDDLADADAIGRDADLVLLLHRPSEASQDRELIVDKNRHGPEGLFTLTFSPEATSFRATAGSPEPEAPF